MTTLSFCTAKNQDEIECDWQEFLNKKARKELYVIYLDANKVCKEYDYYCTSPSHCQYKTDKTFF